VTIQFHVKRGIQNNGDDDDDANNNNNNNNNSECTTTLQHMHGNRGAIGQKKKKNHWY
jgi:hypothetical protein